MFLTANGSKDTNKYSGVTYNTIDWKTIAAMVQSPSHAEKSEAPFAIFSTYVESDARTHAVQRERGLYGALAVDVDKGSPTMAAVAAAIVAVLGDCSRMTYSTSSASEDALKWRVLVPLKDALGGAEWELVQTVLFDCLESQGIQCDYALARAGQPVYLPNVPADRRTQLNGFKPLFYQYDIHRGGWPNVEPLREMARQRAESERVAAERAAERRAAKAVARDGKTDNVAEFNAANPVERLMEGYGYARRGDRWLSPNQESKTPAVVVRDDHWISHSESDVAAGIGSVSNGVAWGDAFDLFVFYEHGRDFKKALRALTPSDAAVVDNGGLDDLDAVEGGVAEVPQPGGEGTVWDDYVFLTHSSTVRRISTGAEMKPDAFNKVIPPEMRMVVKNDDGDMKVIPAVDYLTHVVGRSAVHTSLYLPWADTFFTYQGNPCVNSYLPQSCPEAAGDGWEAHPAWRLVEAHLMQLVDSEAEGRLLIQWLAHNVQKPGVKILWAIIICGLEGDGKSSIANILKHVMGPENVRDVLPSDLRSDFNSFASGSCVVAMEEIALSDSKKYDKHEVMDRIKPLITNPVVSVTRKYQDAVQAPNTTNYIAFTNNKAALPLSKGDRRWHVMYTRFENREQLLDECPQDTYFNPFHDAYQNHPDVIRAWLMSIDLTDFNRHVGPAINDSKLAMIEASESDDVHAARDVVEDLDGVFTMDEFLAQLKRYGVTRTSKRGGTILKELGYQRTKLVRLRNGSRVRLWFCHTSVTGSDFDIRDIYDNKVFDSF